VRPMILALSLAFGFLPLLGIALTLMNGLITTVDGMFMILILLTLSGVFLLNAYWEMRDSGMIKKKVAAPAAKAPAPKAS
jgi:predicted RND superfamily exporter protein